MMMLFSILLASSGQILIKFGINNTRTEGLSSFAYVYTVIINKNVAMGIIAYGLSVIFWLLALRQAPLSLLYPMVSLSYIFVIIGSVVILGESLSTMKIIAISIIMIGVILLAKS